MVGKEFERILIVSPCENRVLTLEKTSALRGCTLATHI